MLKKILPLLLILFMFLFAACSETTLLPSAAESEGDTAVDEVALAALKTESVRTYGGPFDDDDGPEGLLNTCRSMKPTLIMLKEVKRPLSSTMS